MDQEEEKVNRSPSEEVQPAPRHQSLSGPSSADNATFTIDDYKSSQPEPKPTTSSLSPELYPDETVDKLNKHNETCAQNPCCGCRTGLTAGIRWVYGFGMFMSVFYTILCGVYEYYEEKNTPQVMNWLLDERGNDWEEQREAERTREICLAVMESICILCFIAECCIICGSEPRYKTINSCVMYFWLVSTIFLVIMTIVLLYVIGVSVDFLTPKSLKSYKYGFFNGNWYNDDKDILEYEQKRIQKKHRTLYILAILVLTFGVVFLMFRVWFIAIVVAFKMVSDKGGVGRRVVVPMTVNMNYGGGAVHQYAPPASNLAAWGGQDTGGVTMVDPVVVAPPIMPMSPYNPYYPRSYGLGVGIGGRGYGIGMGYGGYGMGMYGRGGYGYGYDYW